MSEFHVRVVKVGKINKHPNADTLGVTSVEGYPVIVKLGDYQEGDLAVYIPVDSVVPNWEEWRFLAPDKDWEGAPYSVEEKYRRIKAKKLRGVFSMGLLTHLPDGVKLQGWSVGDDVSDVMRITKYEPPLDPRASAGKRAKWFDALPWYKQILTRYFWRRLYYRVVKWKKIGHGENIPVPAWMPTYTDIEGLRKYSSVLQEGEEVVLTEKIHGSNARFCYRDGQLWVGSHHMMKRRPEKGEPADIWWRCAIDQNLEEKLKHFPDWVFFGEVYGAVQRGFGYDAPGKVKVRFFDIFDSKAGGYCNYASFQHWCDERGLERVPELYQGPWSPDLKKLAEGRSTLADHIKEGFVVKPVVERTDRHGRVIFKMIGEAYYLQKDAA